MAGMSFESSPEHEQFRRTVRDFAEKEIAPYAAEWDRDHHFPIDVVQKMGQLGLFGRQHRPRGVRRRPCRSAPRSGNAADAVRRHSDAVELLLGAQIVHPG